MGGEMKAKDPRCIKCGKRRSDHNWFGEFGYLCHNGSNTFLAETPALSPTPADAGEVREKVARIMFDAFGCLPSLWEENRKLYNHVAAAILSLLPSPPVTDREEIETRFWSIVDRDGLTGLPSDMWAALDILVARAARGTADGRVE